jgi:hypothetical protein
MPDIGREIAAELSTVFDVRRFLFERQVSSDHAQRRGHHPH